MQFEKLMYKNMSEQSAEKRRTVPTLMQMAAAVAVVEGAEAEDREVLKAGVDKLATCDLEQVCEIIPFFKVKVFRIPQAAKAKAKRRQPYDGQQR